MFSRKTETLEFEYDESNPNTHTAGIIKDKAAAELEEELRRLQIRRDYELGLISNLDKSKISDTKKECWFLIDCNWLNAWSEFVNAEGPLPGPISSKKLLDADGRPLPDLKERIDYRGVLPIIYFM